MGKGSVRGMPMSAPARLAISLVVGIVVLLVVSLLASPLLGVLSGIAGMGVVFVLAGFTVLWPMTPDSTRDHAMRENYHPHAEELLIAAAALGSLVLIVVLLVGDSSTRNIAAAIGLAGVFPDLGDVAPHVRRPLRIPVLPGLRGWD